MNISTTELNDSAATISSTNSVGLIPYPRQPPNNNQVRISVDPNAVPPRYRGNRDADPSTWDDEAAAHLSSTFRPSGDLCDCLSLCRRPLGLRILPRSGLIYQRNLNPSRRIAGVIWFVRDPCGIFCILMTWMLIMYAEFVVDFVILFQAPSPFFCWITGIVYHVFAFLAVISHFMAFSTDPGTIPLGTATQALAKRLQHFSSDVTRSIVRCTRCLCIKPARAHHCRICQRCVRKMDHHCPWVNNCVGEGNQKYFVLFAFYICLMSISAICMCAHYLFQCLSSEWELCQSDKLIFGIWENFSPIASSIFCFGLILEALLFGIFTMVMCMSQLCAISNDETGIENIKKEQPSWERSTRKNNFIRAFGSPFSWHWLNPFTSPPPVTPIISGLPDDYGRIGFQIAHRNVISSYDQQENANNENNPQSDFDNLGYVV